MIVVAAEQRMTMGLCVQKPVEAGLSNEEARAVGERNNYNTQHSVSMEFANDSYDRQTHSPKSSAVEAGLSSEEAQAIGERNNYNTQHSVSMDFANDSYHEASTSPPAVHQEDEPKELITQAELRALAAKLSVALPAEEEYVPFKELQVNRQTNASTCMLGFVDPVHRPLTTHLLQVIALELGQGVRDVNLAVNEEELITLIKSALDGQSF